jgi:hypothetical protein
MIHTVHWNSKRREVRGTNLTSPKSGWKPLLFGGFRFRILPVLTRDAPLVDHFPVDRWILLGCIVWFVSAKSRRGAMSMTHENPHPAEQVPPDCLWSSGNVSSGRNPMEALSAVPTRELKAARLHSRPITSNLPDRGKYRLKTSCNKHVKLARDSSIVIKAIGWHDTEAMSSTDQSRAIPGTPWWNPIDLQEVFGLVILFNSEHVVSFSLHVCEIMTWKGSGENFIQSCPERLIRKCSEDCCESWIRNCENTLPTEVSWETILKAKR